MIYIHVPFCHRKCTYCAFYSKPVPHPFAPSGTFHSLGEELLSQYVDALIEEMRQRCGEQDHPIKTVYFGGGTPSVLPLSELERIVKALHECFDISQVEEVTVEANPEDLTPEYLQGLNDLHFVNRLSIGIQSLDDEVLRMIGRRHTARQAIMSVENAYKAGFHNISVDFIYGLPSNFQFSIFNFQFVTHVSAYALTVEAGTALERQVEQGMVSLPGDDEVVRQYHAMRRFLEEQGFEQYEVSNYARKGFRSRHNSRYWDRTPYLGLGPAAHSFDGRRRRWNVADVEAYIATRAYEEESLTERDAHNELLMTGLRTVDGIAADMVAAGQMQPYIDCGWIVLKDGRYRPTPEGLLHADGITVALLDVEP